MNGRTRPSLCERSRSWAALAPDDELSELERKLLDAHLQRCASCAAFSRQVTAVAAELRAASFESLRRPVAVPAWHRRRTGYARVRAVGAAAAVAVMALGIASRAPLATQERDAMNLPRVVDFSGGDQAEIQRLQAVRTAQLVADQQRRNRPARHFGNQPA